MMENTQKKELSSLNTPEGGIEENNDLNQEHSLQGEEDSKKGQDDKSEDQQSADINVSENHQPEITQKPSDPDDAESRLQTSPQSNNEEKEVNETQPSSTEAEVDEAPVSEDPASEGPRESEQSIDQPAEDVDVKENKPETDENGPESQKSDNTEKLEKPENPENSITPETSETPITAETQSSEDKDEEKVDSPTEVLENDVKDESKLKEETSEQADPVKEKEKDEYKDKDDSGAQKEKDEDFDDDHDFSKYSIEELVDLVKKLARYDDMIKAENILRRLRERVGQLRAKAKEDALKKFLAEGGDENDFNYKPDELFERFDANKRLIRDKKRTYVKDLERKKEENLAKAEVLLERLREFLDDPESSSSFKVFKEIQNEWKSMGPLPGSNYRSLWANYNALVNRFYDTRSIYFELKELDRKKNLEYKIQLCEKAEALEDIKDLKQAIIQLNELHHEFKHTGPVPEDDQESVWNRFKTASDKVYTRRKEFNAVIKKELKENYELKSDIAEQVLSFAEFTSGRIKEWNSKTKEILDLQKKWEKIGGLPRDKAKGLNKKFWSSFKTYFHNKNDFFKKLEGQRTDNLKLKEELVTRAEELKESTDWEQTANKLKELQRNWKEIGPVPEKVRNEVFARFKSACDHFFDKKRENAQGSPRDFEENLSKKKSIIKDIKTLSKEDKDVDKLKELQLQFYEVGFVPKSEVSSIQSEFNEALNDFLEKADDIDDTEKETILIENKVEKLKHSPNADKKIHHKESALRKQIHKIENDISIWKNNLEFFANTKNAEKLKKEFKKKIDDASDELERLKQELRVFASA